MSYRVKEIFYGIQGEGANSGRPAVFCRFSNCNLWSGIEKDRPQAVCKFCDTDFRGTDGVNGGEYIDAMELATLITSLYPKDHPAEIRPFLVCTGGEPLLQMDDILIKTLHNTGIEIAVETNGTITPPDGIDWLTVSPKAGTVLRATSGAELKIVFPQESLDPAMFEKYRFHYFYLQPMDGPDKLENCRRALDYCLGHPRWRLSLQIHKILGIP